LYWPTALRIPAMGQASTGCQLPTVETTAGKFIRAHRQTRCGACTPHPPTNLQDRTLSSGYFLAISPVPFYEAESNSTREQRPSFSFPNPFHFHSFFIFIPFSFSLPFRFHSLFLSASLLFPCPFSFAFPFSTSIFISTPCLLFSRPFSHIQLRMRTPHVRFSRRY